MVQRFSDGTTSRILVFRRAIAGPTSLQINSKVARDTSYSTSDRELCCLKAPGTSSEDEGIPKHVLACEQLAGNGFYKTNTATEEIAEIVVADALYAFFITRSFG